MGKKRKKVDSRALDDWECRILETIQNRIDRIRKRIKTLGKNVLSDKHCKDYLEDFQKCFVLVPADKASNNVLIVCKKYYLDVVLKELDMCNGAGSQTYTSCSAHVENLVAEHQQFMSRQNIKIPDDMKQLPFTGFQKCTKIQ